MKAIEALEVLQKADPEAEVKIAVRSGVLKIGAIIDQGKVVFISPPFDTSKNKKRRRHDF